MDRKLLIVTLAVFVLLLMFAGGIFLGKALEQRKTEKYGQSLLSVQKVSEALSIVNHAYVGEVADEDLVNGAVKGLVEALDDPYSHYLDQKHFDRFKGKGGGSFDGVGVVISKLKNKELVVISPIDGTPASKAGIKPHDVILKIDDKTTKDMTSSEAGRLMQGKRGTKVTLTISREGEKEPLVFELIRDKINIPSVSSEKLRDNIGYIRLYHFNEQTSKNLKEHYNNLKSQGVEGIVLDLRNNPGGTLVPSIETASMWISSGPIVKLKTRTGEMEEKHALGGADEDMHLVVLVNKGSASASEIITGALQDHRRAVIVGETTFGKASGQSVVSLSDGSGILLTTDKYLTPNNRTVDKEGIKPDVEVKFNPGKDKEDVQLNKAIEVLDELISGKRELKAAS